MYVGSSINSPTLPHVGVLWFPAGILIQLGSKFRESCGRKAGSGSGSGGEAREPGSVAGPAVSMRVVSLPGPQGPDTGSNLSGRV